MKIFIIPLKALEIGFLSSGIRSASISTKQEFNPSTTENIIRLSEVEAYKVWARVELEQEKEVEEAENYMKKTKDYLDSVMESAMEEHRLFEEEMNTMAMAEHDSLVNEAKIARKTSKSLEKAATFASNKYIQAAAKSASSSMKTALKVVSSDSKKVHPS
ncbi:uncharacterized protein LOC105169149 isoform X1 [Olea europaea subsp. europaea]|uniref:Uncharacterized protein LOC105169149 isoform X1 n=1 Tax=Olea europaea subsp. europaea TaxID=158383 RepID=A0A8S0P8R7_OLEEU|nr:uncharacterized protein LOC105169149 isoform X1 [Olea europaea subsp. europaea]